MIQGIHRYPPMERVIYGIPLAEALAQEIERIGASAVYVLASGTLARQTDVIDRVRGVLGNKLAGVCAKIGAHTPRIDVVAAANAAREAARRRAADRRRRLGDRCGEDGRPVPRQRRDRPGAARRIPRTHPCRRPHRATAGAAACRALHRGAHHAVGRRVQLAWPAAPTRCGT